jgi:hypothetical protein
VVAVSTPLRGRLTPIGVFQLPETTNGGTWAKVIPVTTVPLSTPTP